VGKDFVILICSNKPKKTHLIYYEEKQAPDYSTVTRLITACCASGKSAVWAINIHFIHW
jgi:hypothetical protein